MIEKWVKVTFVENIVTCYRQGCKWSPKKKKEIHDNTMKFENYNATLPSVSYCLSLVQNTFDCWLYCLPSFLQIMVTVSFGAGFEGDGRDLFLTTLAKGSRAVSESECTWLSIIISQML